MPELEYDRPIPGDMPSDSVQTAASYLAERVQQDHGTKNGKTALYWHLIAIISSHAGDRYPERRTDNDPEP